MTNLDVIKSLSILNAISFGNVRHTGLTYAISKNIDKLESEKKTIDKAIERLKSDLFKELQNELTPLVDDAINNAKIANSKLSDAESQQIELKLINEWERKAEWIVESKAYKKLIEELYEQPNPFVPFKIKYSVIEPLELNGDQSRAIFPFIEEDK